MNFHRLAAGIDFSPSSEAVIERARTLAGKDGSLQLVHTIDTAFLDLEDVTGEDPRCLHDEVGVRVQRELEVLAEATRRAGCRVEAVVRVGRPASELIACAEGADLLVVGSHGRGAVGRLALGSVAEEVARRSATPTLVVREDGEEAKKPIARVVVAVDPRGPSRDAIQAAAGLAGRLGVPLEAIHAAHLPPLLPTAYIAPVLPSGEADTTLRRAEGILSRHLDSAPKLVRGIVERAVGVEVKVHVVAGNPGTEIPKRLGPRDILVCGTHGRTGVDRFFFGSVAAKLLRNAPCPVLVVRPALTEKHADAREAASQRA